MKNLKVGDWVIGPPNNFPIKIVELLGTTNIVAFEVDGVHREYDIDCNERLATEIEIGTAFAEHFVKVQSEEDIQEIVDLNAGVFNFSYDITTDTFFVNGIAMYKDGEFIELL